MGVFNERFEGIRRLPEPITLPVRQPPLPLPMARSLLAIAEYWFRMGEYDKAVAELRPLLDVPWLGDENSQGRRVHKLLALAYVRRFDPGQDTDRKFPPLRFVEDLFDAGHEDLALLYTRLIARKALACRNRPAVRWYARQVDMLVAELELEVQS